MTTRAAPSKGWNGPPGLKRGGPQFVKRIDEKRLISADELDRRTRAHRAFSALVSGVTADLGGEEQLSTIERALIQAFAGVSVHTADMNARLLQGDPIDLTEHAATVGAMVRIASRLGIQRRPREVPPAPFTELSAHAAAVATDESVN
jgi:hypothetical protein